MSTHATSSSAPLYLRAGIGREGSLPWRLRGDMALFKRVTSLPSPVPGLQNAVGAFTWPLSAPPRRARRTASSRGSARVLART